MSYSSQGGIMDQHDIIRMLRSKLDIGWHVMRAVPTRHACGQKTL